MVPEVSFGGHRGVLNTNNTNVDVLWADDDVESRCVVSLLPVSNTHEPPTFLMESFSSGLCSRWGTVLRRVLCSHLFLGEDGWRLKECEGALASLNLPWMEQETCDQGGEDVKCEEPYEGLFSGSCRSAHYGVNGREYVPVV